MTRANTIVLVIILAIFAFSLWTLLPLDSDRFGREGLRLGLDLVGGVHLVYQVDIPPDSENTADEIHRAVQTIQRRIDKYGVAEPIIQQLGDDRILVQLPGFTDIDTAKSLVEQTGFLEFREVELNTSGSPVRLSDYLAQETPAFIDASETADRIFAIRDTETGEFRTVGYLGQEGTEIIFKDPTGAPIDGTELEADSAATAWIPARGDDGTPLTGDLLSDAQAGVDTSGIIDRYVVNIEWNAIGAEIFDQVAGRLYVRPENSEQRNLGIFLDDSLLSAPQIQEKEYNGRGEISGSFTPQSASDLANLLSSGALPIPLIKPPLFQEKISATLGANFIDMSWLAGIVGIILVMVFVTAYYRLPGFVASLALVFYGALVLTIFKLWPVTLSLAGFGGFILSIGMAVDANVLIFERMKEELRLGRSLSAAAETGFQRAWSGIRDSNITTIIVCLILIWLASSIVASAPVMGFAWTLFIGVLVSMFTAIIVTRTLLRIIIRTPLGKRVVWFNIDSGIK